ncbi:MAG: cysteine desulfurase NifS [Bacteroidota bacterium]
MRNVYADCGATTPLNSDVFQAMLPFLQEEYGNPSSMHSWGQRTAKAIMQARAQVAALVGAKPQEVIFTSGGTEADNLALRGAAIANRKKGNHLITSAIEHPAVLNTVNALKKEGFEVTILPVDREGKISIEELKAAIRPETILVSIMHANNEIGTIQPIREIGKVCRARGILFHTDAVQSAGKLPLDLEEDNLDLITLSAHKIYGPKGVGALVARRGVALRPVTTGGAHEKGLRPGTENVPGIVGFGKAAEMALQEKTLEAASLSRLGSDLARKLLQIPGSMLNGHPTDRLPGNVNVSFPGIEGESLVLMLDQKGIAASSGSACSSHSLDPSHVLLAIGLAHVEAHGSLRFSLGRDATEEDVDAIVAALTPIVERLRAMSPIADQALKGAVV